MDRQAFHFDTVSKSVSDLRRKKDQSNFDRFKEFCVFRESKLKLMLLAKGQISGQMCKHTQKKNAFHDLMEIMLESMMVAERG